MQRMPGHRRAPASVGVLTMLTPAELAAALRCSETSHLRASVGIGAGSSVTAS